MAQLFASSQSSPSWFENECSVTSQASSGSGLRRRPSVCRCNQVPVLRTITDLESVNYGKRFWGCKNYKDKRYKGCNFFRWCEEDSVDDGDLKIARQKRKGTKLKGEICMLKEELCTTKKWLKTTIVCGCISLGINLVLVTMLLSRGGGINNSSMYLN